MQNYATGTASHIGMFSNEWYDKECRNMKSTTRKALRILSRSRLNRDRYHFYCEHHTVERIFVTEMQ